MNVAQETKRALSELGTASVAELAAHIGADMGQRPAMGHSLRTGLGVWSERTGRGQYVWLNEAKAPVQKSATAVEFQPLVDSLGNGAFDGIGLDYVARSQDGAFICIDQHGVAWRIEVTVTARLI